MKPFKVEDLGQLLEIRKLIIDSNKDLNSKWKSILNELDMRINERVFIGPFPDEFYHSSFDKVQVFEARSKAVDASLGFCEQFSEGLPSKGIYFVGGLGVGKSYLASVIVNKLINFGVPSSMVYVPTFVYEVSRKNDEDNRTILDHIKNTLVLVMDDIGGEVKTTWNRDAIIFNILDYRMNKKLPTIFTSNLDLDELEKAYRTPDIGQQTQSSFRSKRLLGRIKGHVSQHWMKGPDQRKRNLNLE